MTLRVAHVVAEQGLSGDMWLGALVDAGASVERIQSAIDCLELGDVRIKVGALMDHLVATHVEVVVAASAVRVPTLAEARARIERSGLNPQIAGPAWPSTRGWPRPRVASTA